ncbi:hypothetical protein MUK42_35379 [Musa troglodytarum]|uniref:Uncharacterized protein n=1 Tax=Musa troglodytarum TaxID=320322 RepID=A0A9E7GHK9_9LILI|nr:hypothetical protein MUK42_35379 [Musa troglodytarum]
MGGGIERRARGCTVSSSFGSSVSLLFRVRWVRRPTRPVLPFPVIVKGNERDLLYDASSQPCGRDGGDYSAYDDSVLSLVEEMEDIIRLLVIQVAHIKILRRVSTRSSALSENTLWNKKSLIDNDFNNRNEASVIFDGSHKSWSPPAAPPDLLLLKRRAKKLTVAQMPATRLPSRTRILRAMAVMSAVIRRPSMTRDRRGFPAKASSTSTVIHVTSVAGTATASAAPIASSPNTPPYSTDAYSAGHPATYVGEVEEEEE